MKDEYKDYFNLGLLETLEIKFHGEVVVFWWANPGSSHPIAVWEIQNDVFPVYHGVAK